MKCFFTALFILYSFIGFSQKDPMKNVRMHRFQDTSIVVDGWYYAESMEGHFAVLMPIPFNDATMLLSVDSSDVMYLIGGTSSEGIKVSVTEMPYFKKKKEEIDLNDFLDAFQGDMVKKSKRKFKKRPSVFMQLENKKNGAFIRYIKADFGLINMIIEYPIESKELAESLQASFFESLEF